MYNIISNVVKVTNQYNKDEDITGVRFDIYKK